MADESVGVVGVDEGAHSATPARLKAPSWPSIGEANETEGAAVVFIGEARAAARGKAYKAKGAVASSEATEDESNVDETEH